MTSIPNPTGESVRVGRAGSPSTDFLNDVLDAAIRREVITDPAEKDRLARGLADFLEEFPPHGTLRRPRPLTDESDE